LKKENKHTQNRLFLPTCSVHIVLCTQCTHVLGLMYVSIRQWQEEEETGFW